MHDRIVSPSHAEAAALYPRDTLHTQEANLTVPYKRSNGYEMQPTTLGRKMLSKAEWEELRPIVRSLYWDQKYTLNRLTEYLHEHHGFRPTKKQLTRRISSWGLEKNVKRDARRSILDGLRPELELGSTKFESREMRGRWVDKAKLERWMRRESASTTRVSSEEDATSTETSSSASTGLGNSPIVGVSSSDPNMLEPGEPLPEDLPQQEHDLDSASSNNVPIFDWKCVDVVGSPGLTRLIGALTIEECQEISFLDLNGSCSNSGQSLSCDPIDLYKPSNISKLRDGSEREPTLDLVRHLLTRNERCMPVSWESNESKDSNRLTDISAGSILRVEFGISPFPQHTPRKRHAPSLSCGSPVLPESECMKLLRGKTPTEIPNLMKSLWCIARKSYSAGQFSAAESWYRRIVTANQQNLEVQPCETFEACLWVIRSMTQQGKCSEALELHEGLHAKILSLFNSAHPLCFLSRATRAVTLINVGKSNESQEIRREIVQIYLTTFGTRHPQTLKALRALGFALALMNRYLESEQLLRTALHIQLQEARNSEGDIEKKEEIYKTMTRLAYILNQVGRYKENRGLLSSTESLVGHKISPENPRDFYHCYEMARAWRLEGRLHDSENMLQELLESQGSTMGRNRRLRTMASLAEVLTLSGRLQEAARWYKEIYLLDINISGIAHKYTLQSCKDLGFCYAQQAQYGQAMLLFEETIENINLNTSEDLELRSSSIDTVQLWIHRIQRMEARNLCDSEEDAGREPSMRW